MVEYIIFVLRCVFIIYTFSCFFLTFELELFSGGLHSFENTGVKLQLQTYFQLFGPIKLEFRN
jgi:hypothetical protein